MRRLIVGSIFIACVATSSRAQNLTISPAEGRVGSRLYFTVEDQQAQWKFNDSTRIDLTGEWRGCAGVLGKPVELAVSFSAADVLLSNDYQCRIVVGTGSSPQGGDPALFAAPGCFIGSAAITSQAECRSDLVVNQIVDFADLSFLIANYGMTNHPADLNGNGVVDFGDYGILLGDWGPCAPAVVLTKPITWKLTEPSTRINYIEYPYGPFVANTATIGPAVPTQKFLLFVWLSILPNPTSPTLEQLLMAHWAHHAIVLVVEENPDTVSMSSATQTVRLVSTSLGGTQLDQIDGIILDRLVTDGDPTSIVYATSLARPVIFVDRLLVHADYPTFHPLHVLLDARVEILPPKP